MPNASKAGTAPKPLAGVRVVEVGVWHAGPGAAAIWGDLGAEVIKVETFVGDPERHYGMFGPMDKAAVDIPLWSPLFEFTNRNKQGIQLDIATAEGRRILDALLGQADVFLTNLRTETKQKLGLDWPTVSTVNPHLIQVSVTGFGSKGPLGNAGGFDAMGQAISGMLFLGHEEPTLLQMIILDQLTAMTAAFAGMTALYARAVDPDRVGQEVETSLYGAALWLTHMNLLSASIVKDDIRLTWDRRLNSPLRTTFKCGDGRWIVGTNHPEEKYWPAFCAAVGRPDLENDPRFATKALRQQSNVELIALLDDIFATRTQREWLDTMLHGGVLFAPVQTSRDVLDDQQALDNGYIVDFEHAELGTLRLPGFPISFSRNAAAGPSAQAPKLGEHTDVVLGGLGYDDAARERLRSAAVIH